MKNFNMFWVHWKIQFWQGQGSQKNNIEGGGDCLKREELGEVADLRGLAKVGGVFEGGEGVWYPNAHCGNLLFFCLEAAFVHILFRSSKVRYKRHRCLSC